MPKIIFEFVHGVPDLLQHKLESFGIEVVGDMVSTLVIIAAKEHHLEDHFFDSF